MSNFILAISGSPKKGNTDTMLEQTVKGAESTGLKVKTIFLRDLNFSGCCGWTDCFYEGYCKIDDEMQNVYKDLLTCSGLILASPNYFNSVSGLMKNFIDRTNPYALKKQLAGKKAILLTCGGWSLDSIQKTEDYLREICRIHKIEVLGAQKIKADYPNEAQEQIKELENCFELGKLLGKSLI
ncbi:MAG: flavodoxin family protein [Candidatus Diapherotrites archaeon]|nr:flavodoxin family protein [Candidatus Diapherotrites archaeon]